VQDAYRTKCGGIVCVSRMVTVKALEAVLVIILHEKTQERCGFIFYCNFAMFCLECVNIQCNIELVIYEELSSHFPGGRNKL
jgi:hypothetical protein